MEEEHVKILHMSPFKFIEKKTFLVLELKQMPVYNNTEFFLSTTRMAQKFGNISVHVCGTYIM